MFYNLFSSLARSKSFLSFRFLWLFTESAKFTSEQLLFLLMNIRCGHLVGIWWSVCISKSQRILRRLIFLDGSWFIHMPFVSMAKFFYSLALFLVDHLSYSVMSSKFVELNELVYCCVEQQQLTCITLWPAVANLVECVLTLVTIVGRGCLMWVPERPQHSLHAVVTIILIKS